jgi:hypothetical protein
MRLQPLRLFSRLDRHSGDEKNGFGLRLRFWSGKAIKKY